MSFLIDLNAPTCSSHADRGVLALKSEFGNDLDFFCEVASGEVVWVGHGAQDGRL
jgi:hypothetical protein